MEHSVPHDLGQQKAKEVAEAAFKAYTTKYGQYSPKVNWTSEYQAKISFVVKGMTLNGSINVQPKSIEMDMDVPFLLKPFKGMALGVIEKEIREWIGKAKSTAP
jgi:hypothetical protein